MAKVTCVECSTCGNMVWVGFSNGKIIEYNLQSGKKRKEYIGHKGAIKGIGAQSKSPSPHPHFTLNSPSSHRHLTLTFPFIWISVLQVAMISVGEDSTLCAWRIKTGKFLEKMTLPEIPDIFKFQRRTNLAAIGLADYSIIVVDCTNAPLTVARRFSGHNGKITSLYWKHDSRWLVSSSGKGGKCISEFLSEKP